MLFFFFKQKTAYEMRISDWSSDVCSSDLDALKARYILLAAGAAPMKLGIAGEEHLATSDGFLELDTLPRRIVLVGGGYIAFEFEIGRASCRERVCQYV